ncbi:MAG TPA: hypothetical protein VJ914_18770 [Pseudonocardiaceae bacterium]|nr:hypothetical protein [Pseudonocardiaceae bacterium]
MVQIILRLRDRKTPLGFGGRAGLAVVLIGALIGLGFAMSYVAQSMTYAAGGAGTPGVFTVDHCQMIADSGSNNSAAQCTGSFQPTDPSLPPNDNATLANGALYPNGGTVNVTSDGTNALIARTAANVRFYLGGMICVLVFVLAVLWGLLPGIITGWFRFPHSVKGAASVGAGLFALLLVGLAFVLLNI